VARRFERAREALFGGLTLALGLGLLERVATALGAVAPTAAPAVASRADERRPPSVASYTLEARLDANAHRIDGRETLVFVNRSSEPLSELYFHLYLNAFKNDASIFLRSPFGEARGGRRADDWGYIDVLHCTAPSLGAGDLWPRHTAGTPEEPDDETDVRLPLPTSIPPGDSLTLKLEFSAKLPSVVLRTGYAEDFHFVAQWFPKLARLEPSGTFAHFPFHPQAEFYADFGDYDVTLDVPEGTLVAATGEQRGGEHHGERQTLHYRAESVHDFAWAAWPGFQERTRRIDGVAVRVFFPPGHERNAARTLDTLDFVLPRASALYGRYPYPTLDVVHPPAQASEAGGMEYPSLIATGGPWYAGLLGDRGIESVTTHELLHQWFYGLLASNEARSPFLDEGLTSYAELSALEEGFGAGSAFDGFDFELSVMSLSRAFAAARAEDVAISSPAAAFPSFRTLGALVYSRTATILETLARVYGRARFAGALGKYARRFRFAHPTPSDFIGVVGEELGPEAERVLNQALNERGRVNFLVRDVQSAPEKTLAGVFDRTSGRETIEPSSAIGQHYRGRAVILRHGTLELPVDIDLFDENGGRQRAHWDGHGALHVVDWRGAARLAHVVVDPEHKILLDDNLLDNAAAARPGGAPRTLERATYLAELGLALLVP